MALEEADVALEVLEEDADVVVEVRKEVDVEEQEEGGVAQGMVLEVDTTIVSVVEVGKGEGEDLEEEPTCSGIYFNIRG